MDCEYKVVVTRDAEEDLERFINYAISYRGSCSICG